MILAIKTDQPQAELVLIRDKETLEHYTWQADRELSATLLQQMDKLLKRHRLDWSALSGLVVFKGPGSFTGLRIGVTVANTLAYGLGIPVVGAKGKDWVQQSLVGLSGAKPGTQVLPEYGAEPNITQPKK